VITLIERRPRSGLVPRLPFGEAHVWQTSVSANASLSDWLRELLDPAEQDRLVSFRFEADRRRYAVAHGTLRRVLGAYLGCKPRLVPFSTTRSGKPVLPSALWQTGLSFSLSHDGDLVLIAVARAARVGVDVQSHDVPLDLDLIAEVGLSSSEQALVAELGHDDRRSHVVQLWARKEAIVKATGLGMAGRPEEIDLSGDSPPWATDLGHRFSIRPVVCDLPTAAGYSAALATQGWCRRVVQMNWESGS
jgi:4'-phosphopantetheinyl transferase